MSHCKLNMRAYFLLKGNLIGDRIQDRKYLVSVHTQFHLRKPLMNKECHRLIIQTKIKTTITTTTRESSQAAQVEKSTPKNKRTKREIF